MSAADRLAQQLGSSLNAPGNSAVFRAILTLLSEGAAVPKAAVARRLGRALPWIAAAVAIGFWAAPYIIERIFG